MDTKLNNALTIIRPGHFQVDTGLCPTNTNTQRKLIFHASYGLIDFKSTDVILFSLEKQQEGFEVSLDEVMYALESEDFIILGRNVMDLFLFNECTLPENTSIEKLYFLGDIYQTSLGRLVSGICPSVPKEKLEYDITLKSIVDGILFSKDDKFAVLRRKAPKGRSLPI